MKRATAAALAVSSAAMCVGSAVLLLVTWELPVGDLTWGFHGFQLILAVGFTAIGTIVALRRPSHRIGWLLLAIGVIWAIDELLFEYCLYAVVGRPRPLEGGVFAAWVGSWLWTVGIGLYSVIFVTFPDGRAATATRRLVVGASGVMTLGLAAQMALRPGPLQLAAFVDNPYTPLAPSVIDALGAATLALSFPVAIGAGWSLVTRFRGAGGIERQQLKWLAFSALPVGIIGPLSAIVPGKPIQILGAMGQLSLPVAIAIAVLRYRLYDIDVLIRRTLIYGALSAVVASVYLSLVVVVQAALRPITSGSELAVAASTLATLGIVQPLRSRIQAAVDHRFYRSRYDAVRTLDAFTTRMRDQVDIDAVSREVLDVVGVTLRPAHASVWLASGLPLDGVTISGRAVRTKEHA